ncbi:penicillin acylase family protein [Promicromonospora kroppenstedtii]|uniref:penicillin acylase family protein n=1 Tax=Promicromonospora kroppenstedtii TaxID=440482 RepID=UPI000686D9EA|nr:penicillin acylase family protein [Promicromonospora kroppenstedtii]
MLALVAVTTFGWLTGRRPLPEYSGSVQVEGLGSDVRVSRDAQGVPQIYADTAEDLFRAQGYVHAQDRFFEMDYRRHVTAGRLAELVGNNEDAIQADMVTRTFGWRHVAEEEFNILDDTTRQYLQAYADGVNAYLADRSPGETAVEYTVLDVSVEVNDPEPWGPIDSLAWLKAMAWDLRGNYDDELDRALAYSRLGDASRVAELFPAYSGTGNAPILDAAEAGAQSTAPAGTETASATQEVYQSPHLADALESAQKALDAVPVQIARGEGTGSNSWVVSGQYTKSGKPLLANDPHLALAAPGIWAQIGLHCNQVGPECPYDVAGFSFSGFPGVIIGHNADISWGLTNMGADVTDFFIERVRNDTYMRGTNKWVPMESETEVIRVDGGSSVDLEVRRTVHGPIISSVMDETQMDAVRDAPTEIGPEQRPQYEIALQWTALQPGHTADAVFEMNRAKTPADMKAAAAKFEVPAQNIVYATTDGHIGYQAPGKIPVRASVPGAVESDGTWPRPGWDARYDWTGYVDPAQMPGVVDPKEGFIVAANQAVLPGGDGPYLSRDWDYGYRSERIRTLISDRIAEGRKLTAADMSEFQMDQWSVFADLLVPVLVEVDLPAGYDSDGQALLADWDRSMDADSAAAAYFAAVWRNLLRITFHDELPEAMWPDGGSRWLAVIQGMLGDPENPFWDDQSTVSVVESRDEVLTQALVSARQDLTVEIGKDTSDWEWGTLHQLRLEHLVLGGPGIPAPISAYMNPAPVKVGGGSSIVNATSFDAASGSFDVTSGPSMRMVVDLADLDASTWVVVTGASAHPGSPHYDDQLGAWAAGETFPWPFTADAVEGAAEDEQILTP